MNAMSNLQPKDSSQDVFVLTAMSTFQSQLIIIVGLLMTVTFSTFPTVTVRYITLC